MSRPFAWRVLGILPILKASAYTNTDKDWQRQRRLNMFHRATDPVIAEINNLCKPPRYYRWADKMVRLGLALWHIISLDGLESGAQLHYGMPKLRMSQGRAGQDRQAVSCQMYIRCSC
jgi:hypothetical protein